MGAKPIGPTAALPPSGGTLEPSAMTDISTSVTLRERTTYAISRVGLLGGWWGGILSSIAVGALTFGAMRRWGSTPPDPGDMLIAIGVAVAVLLVPPLCRFVHGLTTARTAHLLSVVEEERKSRRALESQVEALLKQGEGFPAVNVAIQRPPFFFSIKDPPDKSFKKRFILIPNVTITSSEKRPISLEPILKIVAREGAWTEFDEPEREAVKEWETVRDKAPLPATSFLDIPINIHPDKPSVSGYLAFYVSDFEHSFLSETTRKDASGERSARCVLLLRDCQTSQQEPFDISKKMVIPEAQSGDFKRAVGKRLAEAD